MSRITCPACGRYFYPGYKDTCYCGYNIADSLVKVKKNVELTEKIDTIITWSRKATKKQVEEGISKDGRVVYYHNCFTGEQGNCLSNVMTERGFRLIEKKRSITSGLFVVDDTKNDMLVFITATMDLSVPKKGEERHWKERARVYIDRERYMYQPIFSWAKEGSTYVQKVSHPGKFLKEKFKNLGSIDITKSMYPNEVDDQTFDDFSEAITRFIPESKIATLSGNKMVHINSPETFSDFLKKSKELKDKKGPKQNKIDEFTSIPLSDVSKPEVINKAKVLKTYSFLARNVDTFAIIEKVNGIDNTCVLRTFSSIPNTEIIKEGYRMYVQGKNVYTCKPREDGKFIYCPLYMNPSNWDFALSDFDHEITKGTILEYFGSIIDDIPCEIRSKAIWAFIKWPLLEQIYKAGYNEIADWILYNSVKKNPEEVLEKVFGKLLEGKNMYQKLGVNKFQMQYINDNIDCLRALRTEYWESGMFGAAHFIKVIMNNNVLNRYHRRDEVEEYNISDLDNNTFVSYAKLFCDVLEKNNFLKNQKSVSFIPYEELRDNNEYRNFYNTVYKIDTIQFIFKLLRVFYSPQTSLNMIPAIVEISDKMIVIEHTGYYRTWSTEEDPLNYYCDYLNMARQLNDNVNFRPQFRDVEQIKDMHDSIQLLVNMQKDKIKMENWNKRVGSWSKWEYTNEEEGYLTKAPVIPNDLAKEGTELCHCVKSYISRVSDGLTNIMFIRKIDEPDKPFFTVEITNDNTVQQIHGFGNRNLDTEPDLIPFVKKWFKECKLKHHTYNKVR